MPTKIRISKDMILDAAFEIVRKDGIEKLSNRELANKLKCSIRPIYYQFENVEEMQKELYSERIKVSSYRYHPIQNVTLPYSVLRVLEKQVELPS